MKFNKINFKRVIFSLIGAVVITTALSFDVFISVANMVSDELYQTHDSPNEEIIIIGMDEKALSEYGNMPWSRDIMAQAIQALNSDEENKPAVIGIDTLYTASDNTKEDENLVKAVQEAGNVVTATNITFGTQLVTLEDGSFYMDNYSVLLVEEPFNELKEVSKGVGHLNAMLDTDGILRHAIWSVTLPDGSEYPSFNQSIYNAYMEYIGKEAIDSPPVDAKDRWYLSFTSYPSSYYDGYSVVDLVEGKIPSTILKDKIVLIGPYALGMSDEYLTAIDPATKMYGVEYQANAIAALINGDLKTEVLENNQNYMVLILTLIVLFYFYEKRVLKLTISWIVLNILWVAFCLILWNIGYVIHPFYMLISLAISYGASVAVNFLLESLEKKEITKAFKRYVAPQVVTKLLENSNFQPELGGKTSNVAVLFADIRGFTPLSEELEPSEISSLLNRYLSMMSECVFKYDGTLDKFMGDCAMAFWGAPLDDKESALKAVMAASEMIEKAKELEKEIFKKYNHKVNIGIGINYGPCVVGNFGSKERMDYTVIGDTVNVASRLESNALAGNILVSGSVFEKTMEKIEFSKVEEEIKLKGKTQKVDIYKFIKIRKGI